MQASAAAPPLRGPLCFLRGCSEPPSALALQPELDILFAVTPRDGLFIFSVVQGQMLRRVPAAKGSLVVLGKAGWGCVAQPASSHAHARGGSSSNAAAAGSNSSSNAGGGGGEAGALRCVSLNGEVLATWPHPDNEGPLQALLVSADGHFIVTGSGLPPSDPPPHPSPKKDITENQTLEIPNSAAQQPRGAWITLRSLPGLEEVWRYALPEGCGVQSMALAERDSLLVVGTSAGTLLCVCDPRPPQPPGRGGEL
jgi:hypothetical protein